MLNFCRPRRCCRRDVLRLALDRAEDAVEREAVLGHLAEVHRDAQLLVG